jgi:hypothetical protein
VKEKTPILQLAKKTKLAEAENPKTFILQKNTAFAFAMSPTL